MTPHAQYRLALAQTKRIRRAIRNRWLASRGGMQHATPETSPALLAAAEALT